MSRPPIWTERGGFKHSLYEMETKHIRNVLGILQLKKVNGKYAHNMKPSFRKAWLKAVEEELQVREGEEGRNPDNLTIEQLLASRELQRLILQLPPKLDDSGKDKPVAPKPKTSLFGNKNE